MKDWTSRQKSRWPNNFNLERSLFALLKANDVAQLISSSLLLNF